MKTLIIAGIYKNIQKPTDNGITYAVHYNVTLFGQTKDKPLMVYVGTINQELRGFDHLQEVARAMYCKYFNTDLFNIISMEVLNSADHIVTQDELKQLDADAETYFTNL